MKQFIISLFAFLLSVAPLVSQAGGKCHDCGYSPIGGGHTDNRGGDGGHGYGGEGGKGGDARADQHQGQDQSQKQGQDQSQVANGGQGGSTGPVNNGGNQVHVEGDEFTSDAIGFSSAIAPDIGGGVVEVIPTDCIPVVDVVGGEPIPRVVKVESATWVMGEKILAAAGQVSHSSAWKAEGGFFPFKLGVGTSKGASEPIIITMKVVDEATGKATQDDKKIACVAFFAPPDYQSKLISQIKRDKEFQDRFKK